MKTVTFYNELRPVKQITCDMVDITNNEGGKSITFFGVNTKNGKRKCVIEHQSNFYYEVNTREKTTFIDFGNNKTALITW